MVKLIEGTQPEFSMAATDFHQRVEDDEFWGIPLRYFEQRRGVIRLDSRLAQRIDWNVDACHNDYVNLNAPAQRIRIDGKELIIPAGFFCSYVWSDDIKDF